MTSDHMLTADVLDQLAAFRVVPVVVLDDPADAAPLADSLASAGLPCAEVTLRTPAGMTAIGTMAGHRDMLIGAGTVLDPEQAELAVHAGARFIVSPGYDDEVVACCRDLSVPVIPGVATPTDIQRARRAGLSVVKFFPAEALGGVRALHSIAAPFSTMKFVPTGGIGPLNLRPYLDYPSVLAVGGSWMAARQLIAARDWPEITRLAAEAVRLANRAGRAA